MHLLACRFTGQSNFVLPYQAVGTAASLAGTLTTLPLVGNAAAATGQSIYFASSLPGPVTPNATSYTSGVFYAFDVTVVIPPSPPPPSSSARYNGGDEGRRLRWACGVLAAALFLMPTGLLS